jgi:phosphatidate cytidylyltransferase
VKTRVVTALLAMPAVLVPLALPLAWPLLGVLVLATALGSAELGKLVRPERAVYPFAGVALVVGFGIILADDLPWPQRLEQLRLLAGVLAGPFILGLIAARVAVLSLRSRLAAEPAALWLAIPLLYILLLHVWRPPTSPAPDWASPAFLAILPLWAGDTAAYFVGKAFGKTPLAPAISPKKTMEGAIANMLACIVAAYFVGRAVGIAEDISILSGFAAGFLGQAGDLFQSSLKRSSGVKDSGSLLPGHGGILDRIDSLLFTAPAVALIVIFGSV